MGTAIHATAKPGQRHRVRLAGVAAWLLIGLAVRVPGRPVPEQSELRGVTARLAA
jgi:hypothetical protein